MTDDLPLFLVFAAGLLSFLSPCVLPLIPSYLSILGGVGLDGKAGADNKALGSGVVPAAAAFVLGFSAVFITLGILVSATFFLMGGISKYINWAAGTLVIILGFNVLFDFIPFLNYENRPFLRKGMRPGLRGAPAAFIAGAAFGAGWTPCIGPILTSILLLAGQNGKTGLAVCYLLVYSAGLSLPFMGAAVFFNFFVKHLRRLRSRLPLIRRISGILLIVIGALILTGRYSLLNILIQKQIFRYIGWAEGQALPFRLLADALVWLQNF